MGRQELLGSAVCGLPPPCHLTRKGIQSDCLPVSPDRASLWAQPWQQRGALESSAEAELSFAQQPQKGLGGGGGPREPRAVCAPGEWALQGRLPALGCRVPSRLQTADPSAWASASGLSSGTRGPQRRRDIGRPCDSCVCPERLHSALFPEFDLTISCLLSCSPRGSAWPRPTLHGLAGWGRGPWGFAPPAGIPPEPSHLPHFRGHQGRIRSGSLVGAAARVGLGGQSFPASVPPRCPVQRGPLRPVQPQPPS